MAVVVVGGHSRSIGKTSVAAGLIAAMPEKNWTAFKITQFGHGFCTADGEPCDCQTAEHQVAFSLERDARSGTDTSRYLAAGAKRSVWVRARQGYLAEAMPRLRKELAESENAIVESNSVMGFLRPDLYLSVLDGATEDFKDSARLFLDRADAVLIHASNAGLAPLWKGVGATLLEGRRQFLIRPPEYVTAEVVDFVKERIGAAHLPG